MCQGMGSTDQVHAILIPSHPSSHPLLSSVTSHSCPSCTILHPNPSSLISYCFPSHLFCPSSHPSLPTIPSSFPCNTILSFITFPNYPFSTPPQTLSFVPHKTPPVPQPIPSHTSFPSILSLIHPLPHPSHPPPIPSHPPPIPSHFQPIPSHPDPSAAAAAGRY